MRLLPVLLAAFFLGSQVAEAFPLRLGLISGFTYGYVIQKGTRSEDPLGFLASAEYSLDPHRTLGLEHSRAVNLSPFSSGVSFTGAAFRWYPLAAHPQIIRSSEVISESYFSQNGLSPFIGIGTGLAIAKVTRTVGTATSTVEGYGFYLNPKMGLEFGLTGQVSFRLELGAKATLISTEGRTGDGYALMGALWMF